MARHEADREDLFAEARALIRRAEFRIPDSAKPVTAGFREDGRFSIWFGDDPAFHFDPERRLRRAFVDETPYRTQGSTLARLTRVRTSQATELRRHDLTPDELAEFRRTLHATFERFREILAAGNATIPRQIPADDERLADEIMHCVEAILTVETLSPAFRGKR